MKPLFAFALISIVPSAGLAQSVLPGFFVSGSTGLEYYETSSSDGSTIAYADFSFGLGGSASGSGSMPFGFQVDVLAYQNFDSSSPGESLLRPWVFYDSQVGRISFGQMPSLADSFLGGTKFIGVYSLDRLLYGRYFNSGVSAELLADDSDLFGLTYEGGTGQVSYAIQAYMNDLDHVDAYSAALGYDLGAINMALVWETYPDNPLDDFIGARISGEYGALDWSARYVSGLQTGAGSHAFTVNADYAVTDAILVGGAYTTADTGTDTGEVTAVYAAYEFFPGLAAQLGYAVQDDDSVTSAGVHYGFDF